MKKDEASIREQFSTYSDDELVELISIQSNSLSDSEVAVLEKIIYEKNLIANYSERRSSSAGHFTEILGDGNFTIKSHIPDKIDISESINSLVSEIEVNEKNAAEYLKEKLAIFSDKELIQNYIDLLETVENNGVFGSTTDETAIPQFRTILNEIYKRNLKIPEEFIKLHVSIVRNMYKKLSTNKRNFAILNLSVASILTFVIIAFIHDGIIGKLLFLLILIATNRFYVGIKQFQEYSHFKSCMLYVRR